MPEGYDAEINERGFAIDNEEITRGLICLAAPIYAVDGNATGAFSFTCEKHVFKELTAKRISENVIAAAQGASA